MVRFIQFVSLQGVFMLTGEVNDGDSEFRHVGDDLNNGSFLGGENDT